VKKTVIDTSSLVNCSNGDILDSVFRLGSRRFVVTPLVVGEFRVGDVQMLTDAVGKGQVDAMSDDAIPASEYLDLLSDFDLGEGETECLAFAIRFGFDFCCDDGRARKCASERIGAHRVVGTIRLLYELVHEKTLRPDEAFDRYKRMVSAGGFLPHLGADFFDNALIAELN
jgi:predicted nucleic acid-binding protein